MNPDEIARLADPNFLGDYLASLPQPEHMHMHGPIVSVREDSYNGHQIVIKTTYEITVDGEPLTAHVELSNDGSAHCHGLPAYRFLSVVDMVRALIDNFPDDFPTDEHGGHDEPDDHPSGHGSHEEEGV